MGTKRRDKFGGLLDKAAGWIACLLPLICMLISGSALAETPAPTAGADLGGAFFTVPAGDKSVIDFLRPVFGSLFGGSSNTTLEQTLSILNGGAMVLGGILAAYVMGVGTMQTAHDGEMLGKHWSSVWVPIRHTLGVALVVPVGGGYCLAQMFIAWLTLQGIGFADAVWEKFVDVYMDPQGMGPRVMLPNVQSLAMSTYKQQLCMAAFNSYRTEGSAQAILQHGMVSADATDSNGTIIRKYGGGDFGATTCGQTTFTSSDKLAIGAYATQQTGNGNALTSNLGALGNLISAADSLGAGSDFSRGLEQAHMTALSAMEAELGLLAADVTNAAKTGAQMPDVGGRIKLAQEHYQNAVAQYAGNLISGSNKLNEFKEAVKQDGWVMAGAWYMKAVQMQDQVNRLVSQTPTATEPDMKNLATIVGDQSGSFAGIMEKSDSALRASSTYGIESNAVNQLGSTNNIFQELAKTISSGVFKTIDPMATMSGTTRAPIMAIKDFGDGLIVAGEAGLGLSAAGIIKGGTLGVFAAVGLMLSVALIGFGGSIAIYLPVTPFLIFFGTFLGWTVLVVEAIIAAPIWAITHLSPQGNDFMGNAKQGYMMILSLMLRPVFAVLGFVAAVLVMDPVIVFFHKVYFPVFSNAQSGSTMGLVTFIVMVALYFSFMVSLFHKGFGLIHKIPDELLRWFGGGGGQLGEYGGHADQEGKRVVGAVLGGFTANASNTLANQSANNALKASQERQASRTEALSNVNALDSAGDRLGTALDMAKNAKTAGESAQAAGMFKAAMKDIGQNADKNAGHMLKNPETAAAYMGQFKSMYGEDSPAFKNIATALGNRSHSELSAAIQGAEVGSKAEGQNSLAGLASVGTMTEEAAMQADLLKGESVHASSQFGEALSAVHGLGYGKDLAKIPESFDSENAKSKALTQFDAMSNTVQGARMAAEQMDNRYGDLAAKVSEVNPEFSTQLATIGNTFSRRVSNGLPTHDQVSTAREALAAVPIIAPNSNASPEIKKQEDGTF